MKNSKIIQIFKKHNGLMRVAQAKKAGIHPEEILRLQKSGILNRINRGIYILKEHVDVSVTDYAIISLKIPKGVICLISALAFHEITDQIPHKINIALPKGYEKPRVQFPPVRFSWFSDKAYKEGIEEHSIDGFNIKVYSVEKTLADCFKMRNKYGKDIAIAALKEWSRMRKRDINKLLYYAKICRVENIMKPYLETII